jgi:LacI family transcriptional regulator
MPTIRDVARRAGVAPITVSRVINRTGYIRDETRQRVEAAIEELGYLPNAVAKSFRWKQTGILALILTDITNPFWTTVARGVEDAASEHGFNVVLCNTDESDQKLDRYLRALLQKQVDGVLLVPVHSDLDPISLIQKQNVPLVVLDRRLPQPAADVVRCDSEGGAYQMTRLMLSHGHRRIVMLSGLQGVSTADDRVTGYCRALREAGVQEKIFHGQFSVESGYTLAQAALRCHPQPTALFASNNFQAIGALKALREAGVSVPDDISLAGFDDLPANLMIDPFLTVVSQPAYEMGHRATCLLLDRLSGKAPPEKEEIVLPVTILERRSILALP